MQAGPVSSINIPESKDDSRPKFGFCHYESVVRDTLCLKMFQSIAKVLALSMRNAVQESAKYGHTLFQNTVSLYGRLVRVDYSPQGNPELRSSVTTTPQDSALPAAAPLGSVAAACGGFILKRKNRNAET